VALGCSVDESRQCLRAAGYQCGYLAASPAAAASANVERLLGASPSGSAYFASAEYPSFSPFSTGRP